MINPLFVNIIGTFAPALVMKAPRNKAGRIRRKFVCDMCQGSGIDRNKSSIDNDVKCRRCKGSGEEPESRI